MLKKKEKLKRIEKRIREINLNGEVVLAFDFDELVVLVHLTREVTQKLFPFPDPEKLAQLGSNSFEGIQYLGSLAQGYGFNQYERIRDKIAKETPWVPGFQDTLTELIAKYSLIFLSSGIRDVCQAKTKELELDPKNVLGDEYVVKDGQIQGFGLIVSDMLKGYVVRKLQERYQVVGIGHSQGDRLMLEQSDVSIAVNPDSPDLAQYEVDSPKRIIEIVDRLL